MTKTTAQWKQAKSKICTKNGQPAEAQESSFASVQGFMELI